MPQKGKTQTLTPALIEAPAKQNSYPVYQTWGVDLVRYLDPVKNEWITEAEFSDRFGIQKSTLRQWRYRDRKRAAAEGGAK